VIRRFISSYPGKVCSNALSAIVSGHEAMKPRVLGLVNHRDTTAAEFIDDAVL
jgi:hypothetical protein